MCFGQTANKEEKGAGCLILEDFNLDHQTGSRESPRMVRAPSALAKSRRKEVISLKPEKEHPYPDRADWD